MHYVRVCVYIIYIYIKDIDIGLDICVYIIYIYIQTLGRHTYANLNLVKDLDIYLKTCRFSYVKSTWNPLGPGPRSPEPSAPRWKLVGPYEL